MFFLKEECFGLGDVLLDGCGQVFKISVTFFREGCDAW